MSRLDTSYLHLPPLAADAAIMDDDGYVWLTDEHGEGGWYLHNGLRVLWIAEDRPDRVIVQLLGSAHRTDEDRREFEEEGILVGLMRADLRRFIAQLQAIDAMLEDS